MKSVLSVDVAKGKSMVMLSTECGEVLIEPREIKHNLKDFNELKHMINNFKLEDLTIFMESTGIYHLSVERYFKENGFNTLVINSLTTKNNYDTLRKTKTDTKNCMRLGKLFFVNEGEYLINGFSNKFIRKNLYKNSEDKKTINKTTRTLSRLKAHGIIKKVARKNKYYLTTDGRKIITSILIYTRKQLL